MFSGSGVQLITSAYVFGACALAFATLPFSFIVIRGLMKARDNTNGCSDVFGIFCFAFVVHTVSCTAFMLCIYMLDIQAQVYTQNYFQDKVFSIFWSKSKQEAFSIAGVSSDAIADGAYTTLYMVQIIAKFLYLLIPIAVFFLGISYGVYQAKKDSYRQDIMCVILFSVISSTVASFLFLLWAKIASFALFIPNGDLLTLIQEEYKNLI